MLDITYAHKWYEYNYSAIKQRNGLYKLTCRVTGPDGYYRAHMSYEKTDVEQADIDRIFAI